MKKLAFFTTFWFLAIILQPFFDPFFFGIKINIFFCIAYPIITLFRKSIDSLFLFFLGLSYDYLNFSTSGTYALAFFIAHFTYNFFLLNKEEYWRTIMIGFLFFFSIHIFWLILNYFFIGINYFLVFLSSTLWIEVIPTIFVLTIFLSLLRKAEKKIFH